MKAFLSVMTLIIFASPASFAKIRVLVRDISQVHYDGRNLKIDYRMGGGCEDHTGEVQLLFDKETKTVSMEIYDITMKPDLCEAYISGSVTIDLKDQVARLLEKEGLNASTAWYVNVQLPQVNLYPFEP